jgi:hypothetical protein
MRKTMLATAAVLMTLAGNAFAAEVAMVVVGMPTNLEETKAVSQVGKAKQVMAGLFDKLAASKTVEK